MQRLSASGDFDLTISDIHTEQLERFAEGYGARATPSNKEAAGESDLIIVAVKPWDVGTILDEISPAIEDEEKAGFVAAVYDGVEAATEQARRLAK